MNLKKNIARLATAAMVVSSLATFAPVNAATIVGAKDTMTRAQAGVSAVHTFTFPSATATLASTITFPANFTITAVSGTGATFSGQVVTVAAGNSPDGVTVTATPTAAGSYEIDLAGENSAAIGVSIVTDDTINVTATVDPSITFDVGTNGTCDGSWTSSTYSVDFGHLNGTRKVGSSDDSSVQHICTKLSTNATSGAVVTAKNANGANGLVSVSKPADKIASTTGAIDNGGTPRYGMCITATSGTNGSSTPASTSPSDATSAFKNGAACTNSLTADSINAFDGTAQTVWTVAGVTDSSFFQMNLKAQISATQPAHNDYADSITFVATATF